MWGSGLAFKTNSSIYKNYIQNLTHSYEYTFYIKEVKKLLIYGMNNLVEITLISKLL